ncbi:MAG: D-fructose-6-phosphate amidotransferase [Dehalococcoidia bacterium]|nr:D-fructose-6-phosphate amidotransferase [Dehalococcoidia bacterium]
MAEGVEPHSQGSESGKAGYIVGDIEVTDLDTYSQYAAGVPGTVAAFGGKYLVRGVSGKVLEGGWTPKRLVVLEFESIQRAKEWYNSPEYADLKKIRQSASNGNLIFADGA